MKSPPSRNLPILKHGLLVVAMHNPLAQGLGSRIEHHPHPLSQHSTRNVFPMLPSTWIPTCNHWIPNIVWKVQDLHVIETNVISLHCVRVIYIVLTHNYLRIMTFHNMTYWLSNFHYLWVDIDFIYNFKYSLRNNLHWFQYIFI